MHSLFLFFFITQHSARQFRGEIATGNESWIPIDHFCFFIDSGSLDYVVKYPIVTNLSLLFYFDTQWENVNNNVTSTLQQRLAPLNPLFNQVQPLFGETPMQKCHEEKINGIRMMICEGTRRFISVHSRCWYLVIMQENLVVSNSSLETEFDLVWGNGKEAGALLWHFSADEYYLLPINVGFYTFNFIIFGVSLVVAMRLKSRNTFPSTYYLYQLSILIECVALLSFSIYYCKLKRISIDQSDIFDTYSLDGIGVVLWKTIGYVARSLRKGLFLLYLLVIAKVHIDTSSKSLPSRILLNTLQSCQTFLFTILAIIYALFSMNLMSNTFDPTRIQHELITSCGLSFIIVHMIFWTIWLFLSMISQKRQFLLTSVMSFWFFLGLFTWLMANFVLSDTVRKEVIDLIECSTTVYSFLFFLIFNNFQTPTTNQPISLNQTEREPSIYIKDISPEILTGGKKEMNEND
ncbi:unnamed protein product, partial [Mesorhabditis belari]|uniref:GPR180-like N-terminal domain-containing protein n=1 Tax=Mesorhabditis belari TaxID=2138241 RepID=A0AAF3ENS9_9BILA